MGMAMELSVMTLLDPIAALDMAMDVEIMRVLGALILMATALAMVLGMGVDMGKEIVICLAKDLTMAVAMHMDISTKGSLKKILKRFRYASNGSRYSLWVCLGRGK